MIIILQIKEIHNSEFYLFRQAEVLPERELSGELKDVWTAIQYKRESEQSMNYLQSKGYQPETGLQSNIPKQAKLGNNSDTTLKIYHIDKNPTENKEAVKASTIVDSSEEESKNDKNCSSNIAASNNKSLLKSGKDFFRNDFFPQFKTKKILDSEVNLDKDINIVNNTQVICGKSNNDPDINISKLNLE